MVSKDEILCPYCHKGHAKSRLLGTSGLINICGTESQITCISCGKTFKVNSIVSIRYKTTKIKED